MPEVAVAARTLPHNLEAERSVLGAILLHNDAFNLAAEVIDSKDFFRDAHRRIFDKMVKLVERGDAIDLVTLKEELGRAGELDEIGGPAYITALVDGVPRSTNVEHYARIIKEKATLRSLIYSANKILTTAYEGAEEADIILDQAEHAIFAIADDKVRDGFVSLRDLAQASLETIEKLHAHKELITGVPTGFTDLDEMTSGLQPSDLIIIAARPSMGKSALALCMAANLAVRQGIPVGMFTLEMSKSEVTQRLMCSEAKVESQRLRTGKLAPDDWPRLTAACDKLAKAPIYVDDTGSINMMEIRSKSRRLKSRHPDLGLIVVDYLQLMSSSGNIENRVQEVSQISRSLKILARDLEVPIIALSQLSRAVEQRTDKRPILSDLRESGSIEQDADLVAFIYRDEYYNDESDQQGLAEVILAKHRNGPTDSVKLSFLKRYAKFADLAAA
jgi:replicative DNA helicase